MYFGLKFLLRLLTPFLMRYIQKKAGEKFEQAFMNMNKPKTNTPEGSVIIDKKPNKKTNNKTVGEYVDFEELD